MTELKDNLLEGLEERRAVADRRHTDRVGPDRRQMSIIELVDLAEEAGHPFATENEAHMYRRRKIFAQAVANLLEDFRRANQTTTRAN